MRFGKWRGLPLGLALAAIVAMGSSRVRADGWHLHDTLPREVPAYDFTTGGPYYAPPIPYGHYAKDYPGEAVKAVGLVHGCFNDLCAKTLGLFHGHGEGCGHGQGCGHDHGGDGTGSGCGFCAGRGLFGHGGGGMGHGGCGLSGHCAGNGGSVDPSTCLGGGLGHKKHFAPCHASTVAATSQIQPAAQAVVSPSAQGLCGDPGCKLMGHHSHLANLANKIRCHFCGGAGCGGCGGMGIGDPCSGCGGMGRHGSGGACGLCGGCGLAGLGAKAHGLFGHLAGSALGLLHHNKFDYFVGAGGPVPLTPGYVPYIVTTRSPRDFFAFPPMNPNDP